MVEVLSAYESYGVVRLGGMQTAEIGNLHVRILNTKNNDASIAALGFDWADRGGIIIFPTVPYSCIVIRLKIVCPD